ncbi:MAG: sigma-70 family RNA polymerase sigma factor, partial [Acidimicrobiia bacterium]|nr:sigma-70 family RNA polymerase sigma factor [Acidimicrobiia bacterium]
MMFVFPRPRRQRLLVAWAMHAAKRLARGTGTTPAEPNPDDLSALVTAYSEPVYRVALSVVRDRSLAEDIAQDTLVKAWLALPTFRGEASLKSWVLRIARNTAISTIRANRMVAMDPFTMPEEESREDLSLERKVENREAMQDFVVALG